ncbi:MAG: GAF domain-containing sensor histidine kinase [Opitutaceae bacterium]
MTLTPAPFNESVRQKVLKDMEILDTPSEHSYDELVELVAQICDAPIALISLGDKSGHWLKAKIGLDPEQSVREAPFCAYCMIGDGVFEVRDTLEDERFSNNPFVTSEPNIRFYAGAPIYAGEGLPLGTLCVMDRKPRELSEFQRSALLILSKQVAAKLELRLSHKQTVKKHAELQVAHKSLKSLFQVIAHDLRSPFNGLLGITELLARDFDSIPDGDVQRLLNTLNKSASETFVMLENLLEWSNVELGSMRYQPQVLPLKDLVQDAISILSTMSERKDIRLVLDLPDDMRVLADEAMIASVLRNLTSNAIKFTPSRGTISISAQAREGRLMISISDSGVGMTIEQVQEVMAARKVESVLGTRGERGSGVGLMLIHEFLAQHDSKLHVKSIIGGGTVTSFELRIAKY